MTLAIRTTGRVAPLPEAELDALREKWPAALCDAPAELRVAESAGAFRAELEVAVRGVRVVGRGRGADALAAARAAFAEMAERGRTHGAWLAAASEASSARGARVLSHDRAAIERELAGAGAFVYVDAESGALTVVGRSEDGRLDRIAIDAT